MYLSGVAANEATTREAFTAWSVTPRVWGDAAGNDATCEDASPALGAVAPQAAGASDVAQAAAVRSAWSRRYELQQAACAHRSAVLVALIVAAIRAAGAKVRRAYARHRQRRQARVIDRELHQLDDRMLHDLGFTRDEISSIAAEATGRAEYTRIRVLQSVYSLPA
jgi:uncharacterized protein YjiS (DUF1127 family)